MDLRQLYYFLAVAETQNVSRAATRVWISQPALSRQLQTLEDELGVQLFERRARGVILTEAGELLQRQATAVMKDVSSMKEQVSAHATQPVGQVTLGIPSAFRTMLTQRVATHFSLAFPNVLLRIREGTSRLVRDTVASGETDLAIISTEEPSNPLSCVPLLSEQLVAIAVPEARLSMTKPISLKNLCKSPLILTSYPNSLRQIVDREAARAGAVVKVGMEVDSSALMLDLVRQGVGYAVLPYCAAHELVASGVLSASPIQNIRIDWLIAHSRERSLSLAARKLAEMIASEAQQLVTRGLWPGARLLNTPSAALRSSARTPGSKSEATRAKRPRSSGGATTS